MWGAWAWPASILNDFSATWKGNPPKLVWPQNRSLRRDSLLRAHRAVVWARRPKRTLQQPLQKLRGRPPRSPRADQTRAGTQAGFPRPPQAPRRWLPAANGVHERPRGRGPAEKRVRRRRAGTLWQEAPEFLGASVKPVCSPSHSECSLSSSAARVSAGPPDGPSPMGTDGAYT